MVCFRLKIIWTTRLPKIFFSRVLNTHNPVSKKVQRFNSNRFMTKQLHKVIMRRSRLKSNYNKTRSPENWDNCKKQSNFCVDLRRRTKGLYIKYVGGGTRGLLWGSWNILGIYWWAMKHFSKLLMGHKIFSYVLLS